MKLETAQRELLRQRGFSPIPVNGKRPAFDQWQEKTETNTQEIELWEHLFPYAPNTGILTRKTPAIDVDITNPEAAEAVEALARDRFEERGYFLVRIGLPPKKALPQRRHRRPPR